MTAKDGKRTSKGKQSLRRTREEGGGGWRKVNQAD
jgi:hypothetical protein